jgi:hypothetical protein
MNECYNIVVVVKVATAVRGGSRSAYSDRGLILGVVGLGKPNRGRDRGETKGRGRYFPLICSSAFCHVHGIGA